MASTTHLETQLTAVRAAISAYDVDDGTGVVVEGLTVEAYSLEKLLDLEAQLMRAISRNSGPWEQRSRFIT